MTEPLTINPDEPTNKGLDYASLKIEGTTLIQQLAGKIWTDYNEHDPGVTTLEQLCYALTELSYRAEFPLQDLLIDKPNGKINPRRQALFIPRRILPCNPLTENDYRKLIVDLVPQVANVWLWPYRFSVPSRAVNGLYEVALYIPNADPCVCDVEFQPKAIRQRVRRVYNRHRNLCEDVHSIFILKPVRTVVTARVTISGALVPEAILAGIFFNLGNFLAPELRRQSLNELLDLGKTSDEIFNGPPLRNGFIADDQLQPKVSEIGVQQLAGVMARSKGVTTVTGVTVQVGDRKTIYSGDQRIPVATRGILQLFTQPETKLGGFSIKLFKKGIEYQPNPVRVQRELNKLWAEWRRTYKLVAQYEEFFALPKGQYHDVKRYYSIQNQYPNVYGINADGLPSEAPVMRQAQVKQLKGYLLVFEQLLADYFSQLAHVRDLYSIEYQLRQTYFFQYLTPFVPNIEPLLKEDYQAGLGRIIRSQDNFVFRRNRFLDFLLALYAEELNASSFSVLSDCEQPDEDSQESLMRAKLAFLHHLVASTHNRGRGFDYLGPPSIRNIAGMEIKSRIQLGMDAFDPGTLTEVLDEHALEIVATEAEASIGRTLPRHADFIEEHFIPITSLATRQERPDELDSRPALTIMPLRSQTMTPAFLRAAGEIENFRVGSLPGDQAVTLVCKSPSESDWRLVWKYPDMESVDAGALVGLMQRLKRCCQQLYIVEHSLLRFGRSKPENESNTTEGDYRWRGDQGEQVEPHYPRRFDYSFTITAVVSAPEYEEYDENYKTIVREVIRQNTPSHIVTEYCFLRPHQLRHFESLYWAWRFALRRRRLGQVISASARLRRFLRRCQRHDRGFREE
ncbi:MAG TPA: hypothetical protein VE135_04800 [Pyrinomonadaceae bacterium]|nr:hypothetical protein [Pyrinomonadaceae bacterium]